MNKTKIEWCDSTWNPITGCFNDCEYCYARKMAERFGGKQKYANVFEENEPVRNHAGKIMPYPHSFSPTLHRYKLDELQKWTKPRTIFVGSMSDMFGDWIPDEWITEVFEVCKNEPQHNYLFLTKNPCRYLHLLSSSKLPFQKNMWYGITVTDNISLENAVSVFGQLPLRSHTFLSIEPLLEDLSFSEELEKQMNIYVDQIIIGAETGNRKGKIIPRKEWIDNILASANIPVFMKDSLLPVMGKENMYRELWWEKGSYYGNTSCDKKRKEATAENIPGIKTVEKILEIPELEDD